MTHLSIVIPKSGSAAHFEDTLASVLSNRPPDCEVLVVSAGAYDDPYDLAGEVRFVEADPQAGPLDLINAGFQQMRGEIVHLLQCGVEVEEGWTDAAAREFQDPAVGSVSPLVLSRDGIATAGVCVGFAQSRKLVVCNREGDDERHDGRILGPTLTAGFYRARAITQTRGIDTKMDEAIADLDLALSLRQLGYTARCQPASRVRGQVASGHIPRAFRAAQLRERLFWKHWSMMALPGHLLIVLAELATNLAHRRALASLAGRLCGLLQAPMDRRRGRRAALARTGAEGKISRTDAAHHSHSRPKTHTRPPAENPASSW